MAWPTVVLTKAADVLASEAGQKAVSDVWKRIFASSKKPSSEDISNSSLADMLGNLPTDEETARAFGALENKMNERVDALTAKFVESTNQTRLLVLAIGALQIALLVTVLVRS